MSERRPSPDDPHLSTGCAGSVACMLRSMAACAFILCFAPTAHADWGALQALERNGAVVSALAVDLDNGAVLQQLNAERRLTPASLTKLAVAAATLNRWPADKVFETRLLAHGTLHAGELTGDVILDGAGDPTLEYHALLALAVQASGAGVSSVHGRVAPVGSCHTATPRHANMLAGR